MEFEFDPKKGASNRRKHRIDFIEAQLLWADPDLVEIPARTTDEPRLLVVGKIEDRHWSAVITPRAGLTRIRLGSIPPRWLTSWPKSEQRFLAH